MIDLSSSLEHQHVSILYLTGWIPHSLCCHWSFELSNSKNLPAVFEMVLNVCQAFHLKFLNQFKVIKGLCSCTIMLFSKRLYSLFKWQFTGFGAVVSHHLNHPSQFEDWSCFRLNWISVDAFQTELLLKKSELAIFKLAFLTPGLPPPLGWEDFVTYETFF